MRKDVKYFTAETFEAAVKMAEEYFECEKKHLTIEVITGKEGSLSWLILAMKGHADIFANMNGSFKLYYESDGVYLEIYEKRGDGVPLDRTELSTYIKRKNVSKIDGTTTLSLTTKGRGREKIAPAQEEFFYGEFLVVDVQANGLEATAKLLAPEKGGSEITFEEAETLVKNAGIVCGYKQEVLRRLVDAKDYDKTVVIAEAVAPEDGEDAKLIFHFDIEKKTSKPKIMENYKVDYKTLDLFESVTEGQLLVTKVPATQGSPGTTVTGKEIKQKPGKDTNLPKSKNTITSEDKMKMYAKTTGLVEYVGGSVNVSNIYKVEGDCGLSVGNIDFDGSVHVTGNVVTGHVIKATGSVIIGGVVEASEIIAGGSVEVKRGMQGMDKGRIEAAGSISILYIERGIAVAGESVTVDASIHSTIEAGDSIIAKGKRGSIIGGHVRAAGEIIANSIGSISHAQTEVEVGFMPQKRKRLSFLEEEIERVKLELEKLEKIETYLEKAAGRMDKESHDKLRISSLVSKKGYMQQLAEFEAEHEELSREAESATNGKVHVFKTVYPNVKITIGHASTKINNDQEFSTFKFSGGDIIFLPCELSRR